MIRITGGAYRGRILKTPPGEITRPALATVRLAVFNVLSAKVAGSRFLDLFGGSGAFAIEAVSRGAEEATIVDVSRKAISVIRANVETLGLDSKITVLHSDALKVIHAFASKDKVFDIIAVAPPHFAGLVDSAMAKLDEYSEIISDNGVVFVQHHRDEPITVGLVNLRPGREYVYGTTRINIISKSGVASQG